MGVGKDYFDELEIEYTEESPEATGEAVARLLYCLKCAMNGSRMTLRANPIGDGGEVVSCSTEWLDYFGYTLEEQDEQGSDLYDTESKDLAELHADHKLAAPYVANVKRKDKNSQIQNIQGMNILAGDIEWRVVIFSDFE